MEHGSIHANVGSLPQGRDQSVPTNRCHCPRTLVDGGEDAINWSLPTVVIVPDIGVLLRGRHQCGP